MENHQKKKLRKPPQLHGLDFSDNEIEFVRKNKRLLQLGFFTEMPCNFNCPYCFTNEIRNNFSNESLSLHDYKNIFLQVKELGAKSILWLGNGEPFLYPHFWELIEVANKIELTVVIFSNGSKIDKVIANKLFELDVSLYIKLNSFKSEIQNKLIGNIVGGSSLIRSSINNLIAAGFNSCTPSRLAIQSVITNYNFEEIQELYRWARDNNIIPLFELLIHLSSANTEKLNEIEIENSLAKKIFLELLALDEMEYNYTWLAVPPYVGGPCKRFYYSLTIDSIGNVRPCGGSKLTLGNFRQFSLQEILNMDFTTKIRNLKNFLEGKCKKCNFDCCGCREEAFLKGGNYFSEYSKCWYN